MTGDDSPKNSLLLLEGKDPVDYLAEERESKRESDRVASIERLKKLAKYNVVLALVTTFIIRTSQGVWGYAVLGPYIENLTDSNSKVGYAEGIQGIFKAVLALPAGYVADRWSRSGVIRIGTLLAAIAATVTLISLFTSESDSQQYITLTISLAIWGAFEGAVISPMQALYADSNPLGKRDVAFMRLFAAQIVGTAAGPIVNAVLFAEFGNEWSQSQLRLVFTVGIAVGTPGYFLIGFFRDLKKRRSASESVARDDSSQPLSIQGGSSVVVSAADIGILEQQGAQGDPDSLQVPLLLGQQAAQSEQEWPVYAEDEAKADPSAPAFSIGEEGPVEDSDDDQEQMLHHRAHPDIQEGGPGAILFGRHWKKLTVDRIPLITAIGDVTFGIASGMNRCDMRPVTVNIIYILMPISLVVATYLAQKWSQYAGRAQVSVYTHFMGVGFLVLMVLLKDYWKEPWVIVPVYLIRTATINCGYPLVKSILMDSVTSKQRAKWNSLESVSAFGWSGSAALGGLLLDNFGYEVTFIATAVLQFLATIWTMLLLPLVPAKQYDPEEELKTAEGGREMRSYQHRSEDDESPLFYHDSGSDLAEPL